jgi:hypothetical protein
MNKSKLQIVKNTLITPQVVTTDGREVIPVSFQTDFKDFIRDVYKSLNCQYPKFYKMDRLCQLAFLSAELLTAGNYQEKPDGESTAILLVNRSSTLDTDRKFLDTINTIPSPALFVYTLPNIAIGEMAIRHKWKGENLFLVEDGFSADFMVGQVEMLFATVSVKHCVCGWLEYASEMEFKACMWIISRLDKKLYRTLNAREMASDFGMY